LAKAEGIGAAAAGARQRSFIDGVQEKAKNTGAGQMKENAV
jgi:hypothetical protein